MNPRECSLASGLGTRCSASAGTPRRLRSRLHRTAHVAPESIAPFASDRTAMERQRERGDRLGCEFHILNDILNQGFLDSAILNNGRK